jgi:ADP-heptose:LPS heptosyltransferase
LPEIKKILVIRFSSLGDIILSFPLLKKLKEKFTKAEVHFLTKKNFEEIVLMNPDIDKIILQDESLSDLRNKIKKEEYDLIIDIHKNFRSIFVSLFNGKKIVRYKKENFKKFLLVKFKINLFKNVVPVYKKYLLTIKDYLYDTNYEFTKTEIKFNKKRIIEDNYIVISPTSRHFTKTYPRSKFVKYVNSLIGKKIVLVGNSSDNDKMICNYIESKCENVLNLCGNLSIQELVNVLYNSEYVICNDSAILHLAEAVRKRVVAIFGSTVREFGFFPQLKDSIVLENKNLKCRPCTHIGRESCPLEHFKCMEEVELVVNRE